MNIKVKEWYSKKYDIPRNITGASVAKEDGTHLWVKYWSMIDSLEKTVRLNKYYITIQKPMPRTEQVENRSERCNQRDLPLHNREACPICPERPSEPPTPRCTDCGEYHPVGSCCQPSKVEEGYLCESCSSTLRLITEGLPISEYDVVALYQCDFCKTVVVK